MARTKMAAVPVSSAADALDAADRMLREAEAEAQREYRRCVVALADGRAVPPAELAAALRGVSKDRDAIEADVQRERRRREVVQLAGQRPQLQAEADAAVASWRAKVKQYEALVKEAEAEVAAADKARVRALGRLSEAREAELQALGSVDRQLLVAEAQAGARARKVQAELAALRGELGQRRARIAHIEAGGNREAELSLDELRAGADETEARMLALTDEVDRAEAAYAEAAATLARAQMEVLK